MGQELITKEAELLGNIDSKSYFRLRPLIL
jgi:hypothetical protein